MCTPASVRFSVRQKQGNRNTIEFPGIWERLNNPAFKPVKFDGFRQQAGLNSFTLAPLEVAVNLESPNTLRNSAQFLEDCDDVASYAKNYLAVGFKR